MYMYVCTMKSVGGLDDANTAQPSPEPKPAEKNEEIILIRRMGMT